MLLRLLSILLLLFIGLSSIIFFFIACMIWLLTVLFDPRLKALHYFTCFWATSYLWVVPFWRLERRGEQYVDKDKTYVIVSNHQSGLDILVSFALFIPFKWVSKIEVFKIPLIGWNMWLNRYVALKRGDKHSIQAMMQQATQHLQNGSSVYLFPEGTRSKDGKLKPFKTGAFALAKRAGVDILPVAIHGTSKALPKKSLQLNGHHQMRIEILEPISAAQVADSSDERLAKLAQQRISESLQSSGLN